MLAQMLIEFIKILWFIHLKQELDIGVVINFFAPSCDLLQARDQFHVKERFDQPEAI